VPSEVSARPARHSSPTEPATSPPCFRPSSSACVPAAVCLGCSALLCPALRLPSRLLRPWAIPFSELCLFVLCGWLRRRTERSNQCTYRAQGRTIEDMREGDMEGMRKWSRLPVAGTIYGQPNMSGTPTASGNNTTGTVRKPSFRRGLELECALWTAPPHRRCCGIAASAPQVVACRGALSRA
jgi:hypothetical protein